MILLKVFYNFIIYPVVLFAAWVFGFFHPKTKATLRLKKRGLQAFLRWAELRSSKQHKIEYWIHVASHGELEYALPVLAELEKREKRFILTYFSVSAERPVAELARKMKCLSYAGVLPHDGFWETERFVRAFRRLGGEHLLLLKYELWPALLFAAKTARLKVFLVDALRPSFFQKPLLRFLSGVLSGYPDELNRFKDENCKVTGDTRVERVLYRMATSAAVLDSIEEKSFFSGANHSRTLVCGSMWPADTEVLIAALRAWSPLEGFNLQIFWVPHELDRAEAERVALQFEDLGFESFFLGETKPSSSSKPKVALVLKKGVLTELYKLGSAAFVGGGFGRGVHSVWEPAIAGAVVACGPKVARSPESKQLSDAGLLTVVHSGPSMARWCSEVFAADVKISADLRTQALKKVLDGHVGASVKIIDYCEVVSS